MPHPGSAAWHVLIVTMTLCVVSLGVGVHAYTYEACAQAPPVPEDRRADASRLRVASFNTEWLFSGMHGPSYSPRKSAADGDAHLANVSSVLPQLDADVLALVEVEDCAMLRRLADAVPAMRYKPYLVLGTDTSTRQNVGLLTRVDPVEDLSRTENRTGWPLPGSTCGYTGGSSHSTGVTKHLFTRLRVSGHTVALCVLHLLAIPTDASRCAHREGQATVIRQHLDSWIASSSPSVDTVMVMGDFNDYSREVADVNNNTPTSRVLDIVRGQDLTNVVANISHAQRYSNWYDRNHNNVDDGGNERSQIDHLLVSTRALQHDASLRLTSAYMMHTYNPALISDHWPLVADFQVTAATPTPTPTPNPNGSESGDTVPVILPGVLANPDRQTSRDAANLVSAILALEILLVVGTLVAVRVYWPLGGSHQDDDVPRRSLLDDQDQQAGADEET